jgi:hypothetical protein
MLSLRIDMIITLPRTLLRDQGNVFIHPRQSPQSKVCTSSTPCSLRVVNTGYFAHEPGAAATSPIYVACISGAA